MPDALNKKLRVVLVPAIGCAEHVPLASGLLKACAEADAFLSARAEITIFEHKGDFARVARDVPAMKPDLVGFSVYGSLKLTLAAAAAVKKACGARIAVGGTFISAVEKERVFAGTTVDYAVYGEGEIAFTGLLKALLGRGGLSGIPGLAFAGREGVTVNPPRAVNRELDKLPSPYLKKLFTGGPYGTAFIEASRGCKNACSYCTVYGAHRTFGFERVAAEVRAIIRDFPGFGVMFFTDPDFFYNKNGFRLLKLLTSELSGRMRGIVELPANLLTMSDAQIRLLNNKKISVGAGIQSIHAGVCSLVNRRLDLKKTEERLRYIAANAPNARVLLNFIMGLPGDTLEKYTATLDWGLARNATLSVSRLQVFPRTMLGRKAKTMGITAQKAEPFYALSTGSMSKDEMDAAAALTKDLAAPFGIISADKYFGLLFRHVCAGRKEPQRNLRVELCRRLNSLIRRDRRFSGLMKAVGEKRTADFWQNNPWANTDFQTLEPYRLPLIAALAGATRSLRRDGDFADRFAGFAAARLLWNRLDGGRAAALARTMAGGRENASALVVCSANSRDFFKWRFSGGGLTVLIEEWFDNLQFQHTPQEALVIEKPRAAKYFPRAMARIKGRFSLAAILQVLDAVEPAGRVNFLKAVRSRVAAGGQLFIIRHPGGYPRFGADGELTGEWEEYPESRLSMDLKKAGWRIMPPLGGGALKIIRAENALER